MSLRMLNMTERLLKWCLRVSKQ
ncbi:BnaCnng76080D [Brassica napus]|uniref:BnaCnng76080D protein n=1 Tax=Brassica napus TaxID=3708 RepID=A0A078JZI9_BRANA|nr:BnaCnng76080D [Brassica napus]